MKIRRAKRRKLVVCWDNSDLPLENMGSLFCCQWLPMAIQLVLVPVGTGEGEGNFDLQLRPATQDF